MDELPISTTWLKKKSMKLFNYAFDNSTEIDDQFFNEVIGFRSL